MLDRIRIASLITRLIFSYLHYLLAFDCALIAMSFPSAGLMEHAVILIMLILSYLVRERMPRVLGIIIFHIVMSAAIFFIVPEVGARWIIIVLTMIEAFLAASYISSGYTLRREYDIPWPSCLLFGFITFLGFYTETDTMIKECFIIAVIIYIVYILILYLQNLEEYVRATTNISGMPLDKMVPLNSIIVMCIFTVMGVTVFLADKLGFGKAVLGFLNAVKVVLVVVFKVIGALIGALFRLFSGSGGTGSLNQEFMIIRETVDEANLFDDIVYFLLKLIILIVAVILIVKFFKWFYRYMITKRLKMDYDSVVKIKKPDMRNTKKEKIKKEEKQGYFTAEQKARRIYKKRVDSVKKKYVPDRNHTAGDIIELYNKADAELRNDKAADITALTELYEGVRYGNVNPDANYLKKMQNS